MTKIDKDVTRLTNKMAATKLSWSDEVQCDQILKFNYARSCLNNFSILTYIMLNVVLLPKSDCRSCVLDRIDYKTNKFQYIINFNGFGN